MLGNFERLGSRFLFMTFIAISGACATSAHADTDPYTWLEAVTHPKCNAWVAKQNSMTTAYLEKRSEYAPLLTDIKSILFSSDKVAFARNRQGFFYNFWQDATYKHGLIRRTTLSEYRKDSPKWDVLLDLDKLSADEKENWVYKGSKNFEGTSRTLLSLSRGGKDAVEVREYDLDARKFIEDGFNVPEAKTNVTPYDEDHVFVVTNLDANDVTNAGYARSIKFWKRGEPVSSAQTVFTIDKADAMTEVSVYRDENQKWVVFTRMMDFYHVEVSLYEGNGQKRLIPLPQTATLLDIDKGYIYAQLKEDLTVGNRTIPTNTVVRFAVTDTTLENAEIIFTAGNRQSIEGVSVTRAGIYIELLEKVRNRIVLVKPGQGAKELPLPNTGVLSFEPRNDRDPKSLPTVTYTDYLTPETQYLLHDEDGSFKLEPLKSARAQFDAKDLEVHQQFAKSADGTEVPYFIVHRKGIKLDGKNPTLLYGYGGFQISLTPAYSGSVGKAWLERGGVYVVANIRGGGEFGPSWHQAALKHNRQRAYDDFIAVAEHLISSKVSSPAHLGIMGGSNGGLLVGAVMVQRPELFNAVLCKVPLLDMVRFHLLLAGASWIGEYGDPENPADLSYILKYSPYQNVRADRKYPVPFFTTSTKDDRVHPGHARKFAARMAEQGHPFYFYENVNGGHAGSGNLEEKAHMSALEFTYLWDRLK